MILIERPVAQYPIGARVQGAVMVRASARSESFSGVSYLLVAFPYVEFFTGDLAWKAVRRSSLRRVPNVGGCAKGVQAVRGWVVPGWVDCGICGAR